VAKSSRTIDAPSYGWRLTWLVLLFTFSGGCGSESATVGLKGDVTFDGRPIETGSIDFIPIEATAGASAVGTIANGRYEIGTQRGLVPGGTYQVRITGWRKTGKTQRNRMAPGGQSVELVENFIPSIYNSESTLKVRVADLPDRNKVDFALGKPPAATPR
jgi:hypothetical protein